MCRADEYIEEGNHETEESEKGFNSLPINFGAGCIGGSSACSGENMVSAIYRPNGREIADTMPLALLRDFDREKFASSMNGPCSVLNGDDHR